jgi:molecular chaperone GrpE (heat shock protein)
MDSMSEKIHELESDVQSLQDQLNVKEKELENTKKSHEIKVNLLGF